MESVLCFLRYLLLNLEGAAFRADAADFFRVLRVCGGYISGAVAGPAVTASSSGSAGNF